jgi:hypothetical protein
MTKCHSISVGIRFDYKRLNNNIKKINYDV